MFAAIHFCLRPQGLLHVATLALDCVGPVGPELQMTAAEFALLIFFVAGALPRLLDLDFVVGKLRNILRTRSGYFTSRQRTYPSFERLKRRRIRPYAVIVTETWFRKHVA